jgi:hypothetical protein
VNIAATVSCTYLAKNSTASGRKMKCIKTTLQIIFLLNVCFATLSPPSDKKGQKGVKPQDGPRKNNVLDRKLVNETPFVKDIIKYHATYHQEVAARNFKNLVLGYVTPVSHNFIS